MEKRDFFISYTERDRAWAAWVEGVLNANGYTVYLQENDSIVGDFMSNMEKFLENSQGVVAVWSKAYAQSYFGMMEFRAACASKMPLIPVRVEDCPKPRLYTALLHVDLFGMERVEAAKTLEMSVRCAIPRPVTELDADALFQRGENYRLGQNGVSQNYAEAKKYYKQAAEKGNANALNHLGVLYYNAQNDKEARKYFEKAEKKGHASALYNLGVLYELGRGVAQDYDKALEYYEKAAEKGHADALYTLGYIYENGDNVEPDYRKALGYYGRAADAGHLDAENAIRRILEEAKTAQNKEE